MRTDQPLSTRRALLLGGGAVVAGGVLLWVPSVLGVSVIPPCPFRVLTGMDCPFCGGTRGTQALLSGDLAGAADFNMLVPLLALAAVVGAGWWLLSRRLDGVSFEPVGAVAASQTTWLVVAGVLVTFWVVRNLPMFAYLNSTG